MMRKVFIRMAPFLAVAVLGWSCKDSDSDAPGNLCPDPPPPDLELCVSFNTITQGLGESDVGDLSIILDANGQIIGGREGSAVSLDGQGGVTVEGFSFEGQQLTVEAWVRPEGEQERWATVLDFWYLSNGFWLGCSDVPGGYEMWVGSDRVEDLDGLVEGEWQHLAGVFDGTAGTLALYVNGLEMHRIEGVAPYVQPALDTLGIGAKGDRSDAFRGTIDEVMIWSVPRTAQEICTDAGGDWGAQGCGYDDPVGQPPGPCEGVTCSEHGVCEIESGAPVCVCGSGYHPEGLDCVETYDPCADIDSVITEWVDWYLAGLETGVEAEVQDFVNGYTPGNPAWDAEAEAWTVASMLGLLHNSQEVFCLGVLMAVQEDPRNPVALANAAACILELEYDADGRQFLDCSYSLAPQNAATAAAQAFHEAQYNGDIEAALEKLEEAMEKDPTNPEWPYQAIQLALGQDNPSRADGYLAEMPGPSTTSPGGYRGTLPGSSGTQGTFCCPCGTATAYQTVSECTANCSATLSCFTGICAYSGQCQSASDPFSFQLKLCIPPSGLQVCATFDTNGAFGIQVGASVFEGFLGAGVGFTYNPFNNQFNIVADVGTANLPINTGMSFSYNPATGSASAAVGVSNSSGLFTGQYTLLSN